ncbi:MAG: GNAT family N-acetyltransferase [Gemmatimonadota bacterium]|nr:GNAT family N-acetyltransferase [Gemmatimonadota bacterium]
MEIRAVREDEIEETLELQRLVFRPDEGEGAIERYRTYVRDDPGYLMEQSRVLLKNGRIAAHLRVWDREIRVRGAVLRAGGIGSVLTHPDYRGRGYARALMRNAEAYMLDAGYDVGLLFTIIGTPFYQALGWTPIPLPTFVIDLESEAGDPPSTRVRALDIDRDLDAVMAIYERCSGCLTGPETRVRDYWRAGPSRIRGVFPEWGVAVNSELCGYATFDVSEDRIWVKEGCVKPSGDGVFVDLAQLICGCARGNGLNRIEGSLPAGHGLARALEAVCDSTATWGIHDEMMLKGINWRTIREKLNGEPHGCEPHDEGAFWRTLYGQPADEPDAMLSEWMASLPECEGPFYWWSDIF